MEDFHYCAIDLENKRNKKNKKNNMKDLPCGVYNLMGNDSFEAATPIHKHSHGEDINKKHIAEIKGDIGSTSKVGNTGPEDITIPTIAAGSTGASLVAFCYIYHLASILTATILGGNNIPFSNNGTLTNINHSEESTTVTVTSTGVYEIFYGITYTSGIGAQISIAVNGIVDSSTSILSLAATGELTGHVILLLDEKDQITLRNNSLISLTLALSTSVGAQLVIKKLY